MGDLDALFEGFSASEQRLAAEQREAKQRAAEEKRFNDAVEAFAEGPLPGTYLCPSCSAVVVEREQHVRFHDRMREAASDASYAAMWHTPIG